MKQIAVLGSTGSIGTQTLDVIRQFPDLFRIRALSAGHNIELLSRQIAEFAPEAVCVASAQTAEDLKSTLSHHAISCPEIVWGDERLARMAGLTPADTVVIGVVGFSGLLPTLEALQAGKKVLTANKETFVTAGHLVAPYLSQIIPLDSEHSAIFQCLQGQSSQQNNIRAKSVYKLYLTASGGPFRNHTTGQLAHVSVAEALNHPNWSMGPRVTIDSATMMNKGLEIIEAHHLFGTPLNDIEVVIHPQSIVHSAVGFQDGSMIAQLGLPDMRVPIQYGLSYPDRWPTPYPELHANLATLGALEFAPADPERFPCLRLARWAAETGGTLPVVLNAADELAVQAFLSEKIRFTDIPRHVERFMTQHMPEWESTPSLQQIIALDREIRNAFEIRMLAESSR